MRFVGITLLIALLWSGPVFAGSEESARIDGVAQFLIDRAHDNYLYIFEKKLKDNKSMKCYFPNTRSNLDVGSLKELLYSHGLWADSIKKDLDILATRSVVGKIQSGMADIVITSLQGLAIRYQGQTYPLTSISLNAPPELRSLINGFYTPFAALSDARAADVCSMPAWDLNHLQEAIEAQLHVSDALKQFSAYMRQHTDGLIVTGDAAQICRGLGMQKDCDTKPDFGGRIADAIQARVAAMVVEEQAGILMGVVDTYKDAGSTTTTKVVAALRVIHDSAILSEGEFQDLSRYIMFFAQISDSDSSDKVNNLLVAYTLPAVSFFTKRQYGVHWMITAYLGASAGKTHPNPPAGDKKNSSGIFAPIGLEFSYGTKDCGSFSAMLSPFDFGYPVSLKLNGVQQDAKLNDVIAPSISVAYGFREYPIVLGIAYQRGRVIQATEQQETRTMMFVAFDLPLFVLN